jgi:hypothetical protein
MEISTSLLPGHLLTTNYHQLDPASEIIAFATMVHVRKVNKLRELQRILTSGGAHFSETKLDRALAIVDEPNYDPKTDRSLEDAREIDSDDTESRARAEVEAFSAIGPRKLPPTVKHKLEADDDIGPPAKKVKETEVQDEACPQLSVCCIMYGGAD